MNNAFFYIEQADSNFKINLTNFNGQTILIGKEMPTTYFLTNQ